MAQHTAVARIVVALAAAAVLLGGTAFAGRPEQGISDWSRVSRAKGFVVTVTTRSAEPVKALVAMVDESKLVLVAPGDAVSADEWKRVLRKAERRWDDLATGTARVTGRGHREISRAGLFQNGQRVAIWTTVAREDIVSIHGTVRTAGSVRGLIVGLAAGTAVGAGLGFVGGYMNNEGGGGGGLIAAALVVPALAGAAGYFGFKHDESFLYLVPTPQAMPLDEATWRRIRAGLPASLRGRTDSRPVARR